MANRYRDWLRQAEADVRHARTACGAETYEWSCFAAQQAAEKALKALYLRLELEAWGHTVSALMGSLPSHAAASDRLLDQARMLDKHYIPTRYPNGFDSGAPTDFYTKEEAEQAIAHAEEIVGFCRDQIEQEGRDRAGG